MYKYEVIKISNCPMLWDEYINNLINTPINVFKNINEMYKYCGINSYKDLSCCELYIQNKLWKWQYSHNGYTYVIRKIGFHTDEK